MTALCAARRKGGGGGGKGGGKRGARQTLAEMTQRLKAQKAAKDAAAAKRREQLEQIDSDDLTEEWLAEHWADSADRLGRVVGGAERHGQVLVEVVRSADAENPGAEVESLRSGGAAAALETLWSEQKESSLELSEPIICEVPRGKRAPCLPPIVGDIVCLTRGGVADAQAIVTDVLPRHTSLMRRHPNIGARSQLLCANLDLVVLVVSVEPNFSEGMVDRVLVSAHAQGLDVAVVLNKVDLVPQGSAARVEVDDRLSDYRDIGYPVLCVSAITGEGMPELRQLLSGRVSILVGNSGVGKSHLLNKLGHGEIEVRVGAISNRLKLGCHTTTTSTLHHLPCAEGEQEAVLIDSPGARRFAIWDVEAKFLKDHFVEFLPFASRCRYGNCSHTQKEAGCAVRAAVEAGHISSRRYQSFQRIRDDLLAEREGVWDAQRYTTATPDDAPLPVAELKF